MRKFSKAPISFVVVATIVSTTACNPAYNYADDSPRQMNRAQYSSVSDCAKDWGRDSECEVKQQPGTSRSVVYGPYYTGSHYYSSTGEARAVPSNITSTNIVSQQATPSSVYSGGKYAAGASNFSSARATSVASSRGGMASAGHSSSGGG